MVTVTLRLEYMVEYPLSCIYYGQNIIQSSKVKIENKTKLKDKKLYIIGIFLLYFFLQKASS